MKKITSLDNPIVKSAVRLRNQVHERAIKFSTLIISKKLILELQHELIIEKLFVPQEAVVDLPVDTYVCSQSVLRKIAGVPSFCDWIAQVVVPQLEFQGNKIVVCDSIADPGNLGSLIRTAYSLKWDAIILLQGCADPFSQKAIRASKAATLRMPILKGSLEDVMLFKHKMPLLIASSKGSALNRVEIPQACMLAFGNEGHGCSTALIDIADQSVCIPIISESLNVAAAAAILLYHFKS